MEAAATTVRFLSADGILELLVCPAALQSSMSRSGASNPS
jgi:hypothetical protein